MGEYKCSAPVDCEKEINIDNLKGRTAVVTGGANGIGQAYVKALAAAGVNVCIGDLDAEEGSKLALGLEHAKFVKCDVAKWDDQLRLFAEAASFTGKVDYVVANAGICLNDETFTFAGKDQEPTKPDLTTVDVNLKGALYTTKLALHYFVKQNGEIPSPQQEDTCLVLIGSGAAFLDCPRGPVYPSTKWAVRGIMHSMRRTAFYYGSRVNVISPWYVKTNILSEDAFAHVAKSGVQFAEPEDAGSCLLRILSDQTINGKSLFLSAKKWASAGFLDLDVDDYPGNELIQEIQVDQMKSAPVSEGLFLQ
ncbi:a5b06126-4122-436a-b05f-93c5a7e10e36 [Sclerotinia trifoliorum]|uniref:A5b06126-4122-436a-b05f-93c5a7e10e36 n=1 Tax=Sclerotinia trifoliorum TaxID=28548 RepID=A0A8H2ZQR8_9HELO|nr:a5b06126-4122-436a-b05f-93c5a7e10e36 [Sclerotinia trifoliorum]